MSCRARCRLVVPSSVVPCFFHQSFHLRSPVDTLEHLQCSSLAPVDGRADRGRIVGGGSPKHEDAISTERGKAVAEGPPQLRFAKVGWGNDVHSPDDLCLTPEGLEDVQSFEVEVDTTLAQGEAFGGQEWH